MIKKITHYLMGPEIVEEHKLNLDVEIEAAQKCIVPSLTLRFSEPIKQICISAEEAEQLAESLNQMSQLVWRKHDEGEED